MVTLVHRLLMLWVWRQLVHRALVVALPVSQHSKRQSSGLHLVPVVFLQRHSLAIGLRLTGPDQLNKLMLSGRTVKRLDYLVLFYHNNSNPFDVTYQPAAGQQRRQFGRLGPLHPAATLTSKPGGQLLADPACLSPSVSLGFRGKSMNAEMQVCLECLHHPCRPDSDLVVEPVAMKILLLNGIHSLLKCRTLQVVGVTSRLASGLLAWMQHLDSRRLLQVPWLKTGAESSHRPEVEFYNN